MSRAWRTLKGYFFWTHTRGSFHYDVMVTLILAFIFVAPRFIDFKDHPVAQPSSNRQQLTITLDGDHGYIYQADAAQVDAQDMGMVRANFLNLLRPMAGPVSIDRIEPVRDESGRIIAYRAWVKR
jgi:hypothetical protein